MKQEIRKELRKFQFHKGTIKTKPKMLREPSAVKFQFHKGTIKTIVAVKKAQSSSDFNSIKVQLKPLNELEDCLSTAFQFHKGTIKTQHVLDVPCHPWISIP